ncbi:SusC/RagA family TonB-linked outer membrane protein [Chitinophaga solisilvae]|uniref:SusC/RagA family TonB-linked outer membrane protein n=1 Tax=Chitinophaga solisilvae TaxID=1233460 RepID=UPI00136901AD|nr:SusC/RagA family TonB-linked outer membrane protein [Chitinophaga solisilvae]
MDMNFTGHQCGRGFPCLNKPRFVLRLIAVIIVVNWLSISATAALQAQGGITLTMRNAALKNVFQEIKKQSRYTFLFNDEVMKAAKLVSIEVRNATIEQVLKLCFIAQPLDYVVNGQTIVVTPKKEEKGTSESSEGAFNIKGKVVDEDGNPLAFATVKLKGASTGTLTGSDGTFQLKGLDKSRVILEVSFIGYESREVVFTQGNENNVLNFKIVLKRGNGKLDEVQIIAYGETTKRLNTGNVTTIKGSDIAKQPVSNPLLALEGRVPGLYITQSTGLPGSGVTVRIQGQNSIGSGNDPLYVIDGVPYISQLLPNMNAIVGTSTPGGSSGSPLSYINPADIESVDVLKDADATAIYGSRAANGAILITTKRGKPGRTSLHVTFQKGIGKVPRKLNLLNTSEYLQIRREALKNDGLTPSPYQDYDLLLWDTTRNTDWQKVLIGGTAQYTDVQATISGGSGNTQFSVGANYHKETTVFPGDLSDQKGGVHFNISNTSLNQKFRIKLTGNYQLDYSQLIYTDLTGSAVSTPPNAPELFNADGSLNWGLTASGTSSWKNPFAYLNQRNKNKTNNLIANTLLSYQIIPGLEIRANLGYTNLQTNELTIGTLDTYAPEIRPYLQRATFFVDNNVNSWIVEPQISYETSIGKGKLDFLAGTTINRINSNGINQIGRGFISDDVMEDIHSAATVNISGTVISVYKYNALFARLNYNWANKYIVNLTARRDGSSRFGPEEQFHNFGSIGGAWIFSSEPFVKDNLPFLSYGKIRGSFGITGNDQIGDYNFVNRFSSSLSNVSVPYQGSPGVLPINLYNPYLQWEETRKLQAGIELGILKDRFLININYYRNRSSNQLLSYTLPISTGFGQIMRNFPALVQNTGVEVSINATNIKNKDFTWNANVNLTVPRNKLISFPSLETSSYAADLIVGEPITILKVLHFLGVDPITGVFQFLDKQGKPTLQPSFPDDRIVLIDPAPRFFGGVQNTFRYKGIELDFLFQFVKQKARDYSLGFYPGSLPYGNQPTSVLNRWRNPGDIASIQRYNTNYELIGAYSNAESYSDANWVDASFIRLKSLSLSWQLPESWMKLCHLATGRIFVNGQNLLTITNYLGFDPENKSPALLPPLRVMTAGVHLTL